MITFSPKYRSSQIEIMDDLQFHGEEMELLLTDLKRVNKWFGGNSITLNGIDTLLRTISERKPITIIDLGCGDGELLRVCADRYAKKGVDCKFIGVDANRHILKVAEERSVTYANISYLNLDIFSSELANLRYDIALCTLFLHHFTNDQIHRILKNCLKGVKVGMVINDLQRSRLAFVLFKFVSSFMLRTKTARNDGLVSICRAFRRKEIEALAKKLEGTHLIRWRWAFRYQWIIKKL